MGATDDLVRHNDRWAEGFAYGGLAAPPRKKLTILTCMDARIDPARIFGLEPGDAHVLRNAGGVATQDAIRSLAISQHLLGTEEVIVMLHTNCGMMGFTDEEFAKRLEAQTGEWPPWTAHTFADAEEEARASAERIRQSPFVPHRDSVRGFVYDVETGRLHEVPPA